MAISTAWTQMKQLAVKLLPFAFNLTPFNFLSGKLSIVFFPGCTSPAPVANLRAKPSLELTPGF